MEVWSGARQVGEIIRFADMSPGCIAGWVDALNECRSQAAALNRAMPATDSDKETTTDAQSQSTANGTNKHDDSEADTEGDKAPKNTKDAEDPKANEVVIPDQKLSRTEVG